MKVLEICQESRLFCILFVGKQLDLSDQLLNDVDLGLLDHIAHGQNLAKNKEIVSMVSLTRCSWAAANSLDC